MTKTLYDPIIEKIGEKRGEKRGETNGRLKEKFSIAKSLLDVLEDNIIAIKTGLSLEEVQKLREENNGN